LAQVAQNLTTAHGAMVQLIPGGHGLLGTLPLTIVPTCSIAPAEAAVGRKYGEDEPFTTQAAAAGKSLRQTMSQRTPTIKEDCEWSGAPDSVQLDLKASSTEVGVWVACDNTFTIEKCTPRFADMTRPAAVNGGAAFLDYVHKKDKVAVISFLQREVSAFWASDEKEDEQMNGVPLPILPFRMVTKGALLHVHAQVLVELPDLDEEEELVIIRFVHWRESGKRRPNRILRCKDHSASDGTQGQRPLHSGNSQR